MASKQESQQRVPCRLSVILARAAPCGIVLRRGPTKWVQLLKWDTRRDDFQAGQWFKGRIYDRRSDLSPDGSLFVYFANKIEGHTLKDREYTYAWTAISKPPYFTALALWPKGDCWHGGGLFETARRVWLNHKPEVAKPHPNHKPKGLHVIPNPEACGEDYPVWSRRMERDGWSLIQQGSYPLTKHGWKTEVVEIWERPSRDSAVRLRYRLDAICSGRANIESFSLVVGSAGAEVKLPEAQWADWDRSGRLVFARDGKLYAGALEGTRIVEQELVDLNGNKPISVEAPKWAMRWD